MFLFPSEDRKKPAKAGRSTKAKTGKIVREKVQVTYKPEPPPPKYHFSKIKASESEEIRQFRKQFVKLSEDKMEVSAFELLDILNKAVKRRPDFRSMELGLHNCRMMVAAMDSDATGKIGFEEFKYLWNNLKKWLVIFKDRSQGRTHVIQGKDLSKVLGTAGFQLSPELYEVINNRYADEDGNLEFESFISCLVRLDAMFRAFKSLEKDDREEIHVYLHEWLQLTMYI
ncbi:calpain small subunit 1-like [Antechinus flavipes]|uniref:calpain small subunit 1-like n=1 Tax=Antechinus flavipes TaxID=38775 RepID=UPI0022367AB7|nr:calpain small subunit 1-like [Antechinus flavipes]